MSLIGLWLTLYSNVRYFNSKSLENSLQPAICLNNINKSNLNSCVSVRGKKHKNNIGIKTATTTPPATAETSMNDYLSCTAPGETAGAPGGDDGGSRYGTVRRGEAPVEEGGERARQQVTLYNT